LQGILYLELTGFKQIMVFFY